MATFPGFTPAAMTFLRQLKRNNRRDWFLERKHIYEAEVAAPMRLLIEELDVRFAEFAPEIVGDPKRSMFRIYRDVRFSKDKSPYKTHAACWFSHRNASHGVGSETHGAGAGYYFHLEPGASIVAGGIWMPPRPTLGTLRETIAEQHRSFERILAAPGFVRRFGALSDEGKLVRMPRGFSPDHPAGGWLRYVSYTVSAPLSDEEVTGRRLPDMVQRDFERMLTFVRFLNSALGYPPAARR